MPGLKVVRVSVIVLAASPRVVCSTVEGGQMKDP